MKNKIFLLSNLLLITFFVNSMEKAPTDLGKRQIILLKKTNSNNESEEVQKLKEGLDVFLQMIKNDMEARAKESDTL